MAMRQVQIPGMADGTSQTHVTGVAWFLWFVLLAVSVGLAFWLSSIGVGAGAIVAELVVLNLGGIYILAAFKIASQWEKAVVLRFGRFVGLRGPGPFWILPIANTITAWIDHRVMVTPFTAERSLTKDTVPVDVDAVLFWLVKDAEKAALQVEDYRAAISWAAQTALREIIGQMELANILIGRAKIDKELQEIIDERTTPWGCNRWRSGIS
jgi:regulator of protease activity HflC (stomatin/prohibitin superfamily)